MFTKEEILKATKGRQLGPIKQVIFEGISTDSRKVSPKDLFIAIKGARLDGHEVINQAVKNKAAGLLLNEEWVEHNQSGLKNLKLPVIAVENSISALGQIAGFHRSRFNIPVIAVTGSNGKTTTKEMIYSVLSEHFNVLKSTGSFNNDIGRYQIEHFGSY